jgi:predicted RNA-binding protein YlqC (UPF0109 family)
VDYELIIRSIIEPLVEHKDIIMIRELPANSPKELVYLIVSENDDTRRLIGRRGIIANAIREVVSIAGKKDKKRIHLKFESFSNEENE